jgi:hypothetical protein
MKSFPCEQDKTVFTGYAISHEHYLITARSHDEYQKCHTIVVARITCDATYRNLCWKPLLRKSNNQLDG